MQLYAYRNTMAGAKPKFRVPEDTGFVNLLELKKRREIERQEEELARREAAEAVIEGQKRAADEAIRRANMVLSRYRTGHSFETILTRVCRALKVHPNEIFSERRSSKVVFARQAVMYWTCRLTRRSLPEIGRMFGRDHTTILHGRSIYPGKRAKMGRFLREVR